MTGQRDASATGVNDFWHYAVGSEKRGPVPRTTIAKLLASGEISSETYVWQPGMDNWVHLGDADSLKQLVAALGGDGQPEEFIEEDTTFTTSSEVKATHLALDVDDDDLSSDTIVESVDEVTRGVAALGAGQSAARSHDAPAARAVASEAPAARAAVSPVPAASLDATVQTAIYTPPAAQPDASDDLFGGGDDLFGSGPESQDEGPVGVHARRQSSVLFKLDELGRDESHRGGDNQQFLTDSSGLIDIRAIASAEKKSSGVDDPFGAPFASSSAHLNVGPRTMMTPLSMPIVGRRRSLGPWILAAVALLVAGGVALALILGGDKPVEVQQAERIAAAPADPAKPAEAKPAETKPADPPVEAKPAEVKPAEAKPADPPIEAKPAEVAAADVKPDGVAGEAGKEAGDAAKTADPTLVAKVETKPADKPKPADKVKTEPKTEVKTEPKPEPKVEVVAAKEPATNPNNTSKVNDLLNKLNQGEKTTTTQDTSKDDSVPDKLSAASVRNAIKGRFARCGGMIANPTGSVTVQTQFVISSSGVVQSANVTDGGGTAAEVQRCVVGVIKETTFGRFKEPTMQVNLPVRLL
jgi:hypothetical protein